MTADKSNDLKSKRLRESSNLNPTPEKVVDSLFLKDDFFDPRDLVQVKYEMLRKVFFEKQTISQTSADFGVTRPTFYEAKDTFERDGLPGLFPKKRGPKGRHKLTDEMVIFLKEVLANEGYLSSLILVERLKKKFDITVHQRTIERALAEKVKKKTKK